MRIFELLRSGAATFRRLTRRAALPGTLAGLLASTALQAAAPTAPPQSPELAARQRAAEHAAASRAAGALDVNPPELTQLRVRGAIDATRTGQAIEVDIDIDDDRSGLDIYYLQLRGPSGQWINYHPADLLPSRTYRDTVAMGNSALYNNGYGQNAGAPFFSRFTEPGTWVVELIFIADLAGNTRTYQASELTRFGNLRFEVSNSAGFDLTAPSLTSGEIGTKSVSLSKPPPGTPAGNAPFVQVDLKVSDAGSSAVAGVAAATVHFCHQDAAGACDAVLVLEGQVSRPAGAKEVLRVVGRAYANLPIGKYRLESIYLIDAAGNFSYLGSDLFGGETDFSAYFTSTTITVKP